MPGINRGLSIFAAAVLCSGVVSRQASAGVVHREVLNTVTNVVTNDLSDDRFNPTPLVLTECQNDVIAYFGETDVLDVFDRDFFVVNVPAGFELSNVILTAGDVGGAVAFLAVASGSSIPMLNNAGVLLGWSHFGSADVGLDLLPAMGGASGAIQFIPPLPSGPYTFWSQEIDTGRVYSYSLRLVIRNARCRADFDCTGSLAPSDIFAFLNAYFAGDPRADINGGGLSPSDIFAFLNTYFEGCP